VHEGRDNSTVSTANVEQNIGNEPMAKKGITRFDSLVDITITSYRKRNHDPDGISAKAVLDGLVQRQLLADDSTKEINKITYKSIITKKEEKTIIEITDEADTA